MMADATEMAVIRRMATHLVSLAKRSVILLIPQFCPHRPGTVVERQ